MKGLLNIGADHASLVVVILAILTGFSMYQLPQLRLEITAEGMMVKHDPARQFYEQVLDTFGSDNITIIYLEDPLLFKPDNLRAIQQALTKINQSALVDHTDSLFSLRHVHTVDGLTYTSPYLKNIPQTYEQARSIQQVALQNPLVKNNLLSSDGSAMAINVYFDTTRYFRGFDETVSTELENILSPLRARLEQVFFIGDPYVRTGISERIRADQQIIVPGAIVLLVITLAISLGRIRAATIPLLTAGISVIWILGLMAYLQIPVNVMNSVIPALIIIIGSTEDIHLLAEYLSGLHRSQNRQQALNFMSANMGTAVLLTFVTTYVGFLTIALNDLGLLQQFGLLTSTGLLLNFLVTVLLVPILLQGFGNLMTGTRQTGLPNIFQQLTGQLLSLTEHHRKIVIVVLMIIVAMATWSAKDLRINNNVMDYFDEQSEMTQRANTLHQNISGIQTFSIVLSGTVGTFLQVPYIEELWSIQEYLKDSGHFDKSFSFADFIGVIHSGLDGQWPGSVYLPVMNEAVEGYMTFLDHQVAKPFVSSDYSQARIIVRHHISDSETLNSVVSGIHDYARDWLDPALKIQVTGESYLNSRAVDYMARGQAQSLLLMLLVIFVLMSVLFMNAKAGLVVLTTNLFPIIVLFGVMGAFDIALNTGTAMVAAISLGICVDHSMHFMVRYNRLSKSLDSQFQALQSTVAQESAPIIATAIALAVGFAALTVSDFPPVARFGQLSALVMILALISTFVITPILLRYVRLVTVWDMLSIHVKQDVVKRCPLFGGMSLWQARKIIALSEIREYQQDEAILLQGESMDHIYLSLQGNVESWRRDTDGSVHQVATIRAGQVFGAVTPRERQRASTDMVAITPVRLMLLKNRDMQNISRMYPRLAVKMFKNMCGIVGDLLNHEETRSPLLIDDLSGAYSATVFIEMLNRFVDQAKRYHQPLSILVIDLALAEFEPAHDRHSRAPQLEKAVTDFLNRQLRKVDIFGRWQDGSFWLALPHTHIEGAGQIGYRLIHELTANSMDAQNHIGLKLICTELHDDERYDSIVMRLNSERSYPSRPPGYAKEGYKTQCITMLQ